MILYEKRREREEFIKKMAKAIGQGDDGDAPEDTEKGIGGDLDLDEVLPPPSIVGDRVPTNSAKKVPNRGGSFTMESFEELEDKLCSILQEQLGKIEPKSRISASSPTASKVGVQGRVPKLGYSSPNVTPSTSSGEARDEADTYAKSRPGKKAQDKKKVEKEKGDVLDKIAAEMGMEGENEA